MTLTVKTIGQTATQPGTGYKAGEVLRAVVPGYDPEYVAKYRAPGNPFVANTTRVIYGADRFVSVGMQGLIATSTDGVTWVNVPAISSYYHFTGIAYGNGTYVAVTNHSSVLTSTNTLTWVENASTVYQYTDVAFGNGKFVAITDSGEALVSSDGHMWNSYVASMNVQLSAITFGNGKFVAVGEKGHVVSSIDGITWSEVGPKTSDVYMNVTYALGQYVIVGYDSFAKQGVIYTSPDLITWTNNAVASPALLDIAALTIGATTAIYAVGMQGTVVKSVDAATWSKVTIDTYNIHTIASGNGKLVVAGGARGTSYTSDGVNWSAALNVSNITNVKSLVVGNGLTLMLDTNSHVAVSYNGLDWSAVQLLSGAQSIAYMTTSGTYLAVGTGGKVWTSPDALVWTLQPTVAGMNFNDVSINGSSFVAVGDNATMMQSADGITWTTYGAVPQETVGQTVDVAYGPAGYVAIGNDGSASFSTNGSTYYTVSAGNNLLRAIVYGDKYVAVGDNGQISVSTDAKTWTDHTTTTINFTSVAYKSGMYVAVGNAGALMYSTDAITWVNASVSSLVASESFTAVKYIGINFIAASSTYIIQSADGITWSRAYTAATATNTSPARIAKLGASADNIYALVLITNDSTGENAVLATNATLASMGWSGQQNIASQTSATDTFNGGTSPVMIDKVYDVAWANSRIVLLCSCSANHIYTATITNRVFSMANVANAALVYNGQASGNPYIYAPTGKNADGSTSSYPTYNANSIVHMTKLSTDGSQTLIACGKAGVSSASTATISATVSSGIWASDTGLIANPIDVKYVNAKFVAIMGLAGSAISAPTAFTVRASATSGSKAWTNWTVGTYNFTGVVVGDTNLVIAATPINYFTASKTDPNPVIVVKRSPQGVAILPSVFFSGKTYAVQPNGVCLQSTDLNTWSQVPNAATGATNASVANGKLWLVGTSGLVQSSSDGVTWSVLNVGKGRNEQGDVPFTSKANDIVYSQSIGQYLVGCDGAVISRSTDGVSFAYRVIANKKMQGMVAWQGNFYASTDINYGVYSSDGLNWIETSEVYFPDFVSLVSDDSTAYAVGVKADGTVWISNDIWTWTQQVIGNNAVIRDITAGITGTGLVAVGDNGAVYQSKGNISVWTSVSTAQAIPVSLTTRPVIASKAVNAVLNDTLGYQIHAKVGSGVLETSPDGITYVTRNVSGATTLNSIAYNGKMFVVVGNNGFVASSANLLNWTTRSASTGQNLNSIAALTNGMFVAVGNGGTIVTSADGITWASRISNTTHNLNDVAVDASGTVKFVVVGDAGVILQSSNGTSWAAPQSVSSTEDLYTCVKATGWTVVGNHGAVLTATDASTIWTLKTTPQTTVQWLSANYLPLLSEYRISGTANGTTVYMKSTDATTWTTYTAIKPAVKVMRLNADNILGSDDLGRLAVVMPALSLQFCANYVDANGGITTTGVSYAVGNSYSNFSSNAIRSAASVTDASNLVLASSELTTRWEGRLRKLNLATSSNTFTTVATSSIYQDQFGFRVFDADPTGQYVLAANASPALFGQQAVVSGYKPVGFLLAGTNIETIPSGDGIGRFVSYSVFPKMTDPNLPHAQVKTNLVNTTTGAIEMTFQFSWAQMSNDGNMIVGYHPGFGGAGEVQIYQKVNGTWGQYPSISVSDVQDISFATTAKNVIAVKTSTNIQVFKPDVNGFFNSTPTFTIGTEYRDFAWTRNADQVAFTHGIVVAFAKVSPYGDVHVSADGTLLCTMAMAHKKVGSSYNTTDNDNFSPYPTMFNISGNSASVFRPAWIDFPAVQSGKTVKLTSTLITPTAVFYNGDNSCFTYDIKSDFTTLMFPSKPNAPGNSTINVNIVDRPNGLMSDVGMSSTTHVSTLNTETYYPVRVSPIGTRFAIGGMTKDFRGWVRVQGTLSEATTFSRSSTGGVNNNPRFGMAITFSKDGKSLFVGDPCFNRASTGTGATVSYIWSIYSFVPDDRGANINSITMRFGGGNAIAACPDITTAGVGDQLSITKLWPYFTAAGGGQYTNPATISISVVSIS